MLRVLCGSMCNVHVRNAAAVVYFSVRVCSYLGSPGSVQYAGQVFSYSMHYFHTACIPYENTLIDLDS